MNGILAIDIGNTSTHYALHRNGRFLKRGRVATSALLKNIRVFRKFRGPGTSVEAVIASVVPPVGDRLRGALKKLGFKTFLIGRDVAVPIKNRYRNPRQVGIDRLVNALAAWRRYRRDLVIVDFGTAVTFDVVSKKGEYLGGVIAPGIEISLEALYRKTALLPRIELRRPKTVVGRDTAESIRSGCSYGIGGLCDRVIEEIEKSRRTRCLVLATGGYAAFIRRYCRRIRLIDPDLTLKGIVLTRLPKKP